MERITAQGNMPQVRRAETSAATPQEVQGTFQGQPVRVMEDASSLLADAAEELTFSASEETERTLSERRNTEKRRGALIAQVHLYVDNHSPLDKNEFEQLIKQLTLMESVRSSAVLELAQRHFPDATDAHAALLSAREHVGGRTDLTEARRRALDEELTAAINALETADGPNIRAGYNIAGVKADGLPENAQGLRVLYRETVVDFQNYEQAYISLSKRYGAEAFPQALDFLIRALGADLASMTPSTSTAHLKEVVDGIYMVETMGTLHQDVAALLLRMEGRHGPQGIAGSAIIEPLLRFRQQPVLVEEHILREMPFIVSADAARDAEFAQGVRELARGLPHKIFSSATERGNMLDAFQLLVDKAVEREDLEAAQ